jgi:hypothetical protein
MGAALAVLGSLGGIAAIIAAVWVIVRAIFRQVHATEDATAAINRLGVKVDRLEGTLSDLRERVARLEGADR